MAQVIINRNGSGGSSSENKGGKACGRDGWMCVTIEQAHKVFHHGEGEEHVENLAD